MRRTFVVNEPRYCVGWDVSPTVITTAYLIFWGPLFAVTLINWDWNYEDAKESTAHEVLTSPSPKSNPAKRIPASLRVRSEMRNIILNHVQSPFF